MTRTDTPTILTPDFGPVAEVVHARGSSPILLVCEHASAEIPPALGDLGLTEAQRFSHSGWDIGAAALSRLLSGALDAPLVLSRVSRLVYDCNRPPEAPDAIVERSEALTVPGNTGLSRAERNARAREIYEPFHGVVSEALDAFATQPILVTVHSFTPVWHGRHRDVELGILHDADDRLARAMMPLAPAGLDTRLNEPYDASDGVTHSLIRHALPRGIDNVMIEVRNDLLRTPDQIETMATHLHAMIAGATGFGADAA